MTLTKRKKDLHINYLLIQDYVFIGFMLLVIIFSLWKCRFGFGGNDEAFYLTIPQRIGEGDAFIRDEWHLSQMSGFLLIPFVNLYKLIFNTTDGIMITARITYILFHSVVSIIIYKRLRGYGLISVVASTLYALYTPYDIMALSYNTMGLDCIVLTGVMLGTTSYTKKLPLIISGFTFAAAVLCNPYLLAAYIIFLLCVIIHTVIKKFNFKKSVFALNLFEIKTFLWFTVGALILALLFFIILLSRTSISDIVTNLPYMMTDPEHPSYSIAIKFYFYFYGIWTFFPGFNITVIVYLIALAILIIDFKRKYHRSLHLALAAVSVIVSYIFMYKDLTFTNYNAIMFPLLYLGTTSYILCKNKPKKLFASLYMLGIIYSFAMCFSSNQYFYVISMAMTATNIAGMVFFWQLVKEMNITGETHNLLKAAKSSAIFLACLAIIAQGVLQVIVKYNHVFSEIMLRKDLTSEIQDGPAKGILTNSYYYKTYESICNDLEYYDTKESGNILFLSERTWCYLKTDNMTYGTFSAWISGEQPSSISRLLTYYSVNPEKIPTYIYIPKESKWDLSNVVEQANLKGYSVIENDVSFKLEKMTQ